MQRQSIIHAGLAAAMCIVLVVASGCSTETAAAPSASTAGSSRAQARVADGPVITRGSDARRDPARSGIERDRRALAHWQAQFDDTLRSHLQALLLSPEPATRVAAALMLHTYAGGALGAADAETLAALVADAIDSAPEDAALLRTAHALCLSSKACSADDVLARLRRVEPGNAANWLDELQRAHEAGDGEALRRSLERASDGDRFDLHETAMATSMFGAIDTLRLPPMNEAAARGALRRLGYRPDARDLAMLAVVGVAAAQSLPPLQAVTRACPKDPAVRWPPACERLYRIFAASRTLIVRRLALVMLVGHSTDAPAAWQWREQLRRHAWLTETAQALLGDRRFHREFWLLGEIPAMQSLLRRRGLPALPPPGWLPRDPRLRALVATGREPRS